MDNINWDAVKGMDKTISELAYQDMIAVQPGRRIGRKVKPYSLSQNTVYLLETKNDYTQGRITEEEAKTIFLRQRICGNAV